VKVIVKVFRAGFRLMNHRVFLFPVRL